MKKHLLVLIVPLLLLAVVVATYLLWWTSNPEESSITITDALGRTVKIKTPINRVIITGFVVWEAV